MGQEQKWCSREQTGKHVFPISAMKQIHQYWEGWSKKGKKSDNKRGRERKGHWISAGSLQYHWDKWELKSSAQGLQQPRAAAQAGYVQPSWIGPEDYSRHWVQHSHWEEGKPSTVVSRSRKVIPTLLSTGETALGALQQPQFKVDVEKLELLWQRVFRVVRGLKHDLSGKAEGDGLVWDSKKEPKDDLITQGSHKGERDKLPLVVASDRTKGNVPILWFGTSERMLREVKSCLWELVQYWNRAPRGVVVSPSWEHSKTQTDKANS